MSIALAIWMAAYPSVWLGWPDRSYCQPFQPSHHEMEELRPLISSTVPADAELLRACSLSKTRVAEPGEIEEEKAYFYTFSWRIEGGSRATRFSREGECVQMPPNQPTCEADGRFARLESGEIVSVGESIDESELLQVLSLVKKLLGGDNSAIGVHRIESGPLQEYPKYVHSADTYYVINLKGGQSYEIGKDCGVYEMCAWHFYGPYRTPVSLP